MPTSLPVIRGSSTALYPFTQVYSFYNTVSDAENAKTYRAPFAPPIVKFEFGYNPLKVADRNTLRSFFNSAKGQGGTTPNNFSVTTDQTYNNLSFNSDEFESMENRPTIYGVKWSLSQLAATSIQTVTTLFSAALAGDTTLNFTSSVGLPAGFFNILIDSEMIDVGGLISGNSYAVVRGIGGTTAAGHSSGAIVRLAPGNPFPTITGGCLGQYPFASRRRFQSIVSQMPSGPKFSFSEFGALTGFPAGALGMWEFENAMLTDADAAVLIAHYISNWGNLFSFNFTDEDGTVNNFVYYASPELTVVRRFVNQVSIKTTLIQMAN